MAPGRLAPAQLQGTSSAELLGAGASTTCGRVVCRLPPDAGGKQASRYYRDSAYGNGGDDEDGYDTHDAYYYHPRQRAEPVHRRRHVYVRAGELAASCTDVREPGTAATDWHPHAELAAGPQGPAGPQGAAGIDGRNGTVGQNGLPGRDGTNGTDGLPGLDGRNGTDGVPGINGTNGIDGRNGTDGEHLALWSRAVVPPP